MDNILNRPVQVMQDRFDDSYVPDPNSGCWLWLNYLNEGGYGRMTTYTNGEYSTEGAHRISYTLHRGDIGDMEVLHLCDNPCCVNPTHLFLGTHADNHIDKMNKGRQCKGERQHDAKLTEEDVLEIRAKYIPRIYPLSMLAEEYGVSKTTIHQVVTRTHWTHI